MRLLLIPVGCPSETMGLLIYELDQRRGRRNLDQDEVIQVDGPCQAALTPCLCAI
jgi:hypothetical protein